MSSDVTTIKSVRMTGHPTAMFVSMNANGYSNSTLGGYISQSSKPGNVFLQPNPPAPKPVAKELTWKDVKARQASDEPSRLG